MELTSVVYRRGTRATRCITPIVLYTKVAALCDKLVVSRTKLTTFYNLVSWRLFSQFAVWNKVPVIFAGSVHPLSLRLNSDLWYIIILYGQADVGRRTRPYAEPYIASLLWKLQLIVCIHLLNQHNKQFRRSDDLCVYSSGLSEFLRQIVEFGGELRNQRWLEVGVGAIACITCKLTHFVVVFN